MDLEIRLQPNQSEIWRRWDEQRYTRIGFGGARGGSKSGGGRRLMLLRRLKYAKTTGLILRRTYPELYKSHIVKLFEEFPEIRSWWRESSKELQFPNGSRLFFGSAETEKDLSGYYSAEFADIMVDEAQEFSQNELERLSGSNRCTSDSQITPGMLFTFMPGVSETGLPPKGLDYLRRVFVNNQQREAEAKQRWTFVQVFAWDNVEWARKELVRDGVSEEEFYGWTPEARREYFVKRTDFGAVLSAITDNFLREAWLDGKWGIFQGQYFTNFDYDRHTKPAEEIQLKPWWRRWISGDWGHDHPACIHLHAEDEKKHIYTYAELWGRGFGETELGQRIGDMCGANKFSEFWLSWDAFGKLNKTTRKSIVDMIGEAMPKGLPRPTPADASPGSRISGWRLMHQLIDANMWTISRDCPKLIECIPSLVRDMERNTEDVLKVDWSTEQIGDDPADSARYGLQNLLAPATEPPGLKLERRAQEAGLTDPTSEMIWRSKWAAQERKKTAPIHFARRGLNHRKRATY
ncbi:MAG TPA: phage terminase large subunit [Terriglobales bacterium]|nr:phage terminase large subunit [Terriglobales bacterium]